MEAKEDYEKAAEAANSEREESLCHSSFAGLLMNQGEIESGRNEFEKSIALLPGEGDQTLADRGRVYYNWAFSESNHLQSDWSRVQELEGLAKTQ